MGKSQKSILVCLPPPSYRMQLLGQSPYEKFDSPLDEYGEETFKIEK